MKKIISLSFASIFALVTLTNAQKPDLRSTNTRIADLLAQLPVNDSVRLKASMADMAIIGQRGGLPEMISLLSAPGMGNNARLEYAVSGFTAYALHAGNEEIRKMSVTYYCKALEKLTDKENKTFLISQLELVGKDDAVPCLQKYLSDSDLADPASRALAKINSLLSRQALYLALPTATGPARLSIVEALGLSRSTEALARIHSLLGEKDKALTKVSLYALANIADPSSESLMANAAEKSGFVYEPTLAASSYLLYIQNLVNAGHVAIAEKMGKDVLSKCILETQMPTRIAALGLLAGIYKDKDVSVLLTAAGDKQAQYRRAALKFAKPYLNPANTALWLKKLNRADDEQKVEIIRMLGESRTPHALNSIVKFTHHKNKLVKLAAISAAAEIGQERVLDNLLGLIKNGGSDEIAAVKNAVLTMKGNNITRKIGAVLKSMPTAPRVALIEILAHRGASDQLAAVYEMLKAPEADVSYAAFAGLKNVVTEKNLPILFTLLTESSEAGQISALQDAIIAALLEVEDVSDRSSAVLKEMNGASSSKRILYYKILSAVGGEQALTAVSAGFNSKDEQARKAALDALAQWSDASASKVLYKIARETSNNEYSSAAVGGYLRAIASASYPSERKLIMLQNAMDIAKTQDQRQQVLQEVRKINSFPALVTAGKYLDDLSLQQFAANAVMTIALSDKSYYGDLVKDLLSKAIEVISGGDSEYQKKAMRKYLAEMPSGEGFVSIFNGKDLSGWSGLHDVQLRESWSVINGQLQYNGQGKALATQKVYDDFEMLIDQKITCDKSAAEGGEWNNYRIVKKGDRWTLYLNGERIKDNVIFESSRFESLPILHNGQIELQVHGSPVAYRNILIKDNPRPAPFELSAQEKKEGFKILFDGTHMNHWTGNTTDYVIEDGNLVIRPSQGSGGNLYTRNEYSDFNFRFDFLLTSGANNGLGVRLIPEGVAAYDGLELQILDDEAEIYKKLHEYQYHGSVYGVLPAKRGHLNPVGEWNYQEVIIQGTKLKVVLNGTVIVDGDIAEAGKNGTIDGLPHPGLKRTKGLIGFLGHGSGVQFRNIRIKEL